MNLVGGSADEATNPAGKHYSNGFGTVPPGKVLRGFPQVVHLDISALHARCWGQAASTGALMGEVLDPSGRGVAHASAEEESRHGCESLNSE
jgi:hypothetical protein